MKNFRIFTKECDKWVKRMELGDWGITYSCIKTSNQKPSYATIRRNAVDKKANINFFVNENVGRKPEEIRNTAKHEVIHLLLGDLLDLTEARFVREEEIIGREESLVQKLTWLIK